MPYLNIPESKLPESVARIIGKLQGDLSNKVSTLTSDILSSTRQAAAPTSGEIQVLRVKKNQLDTTIRNISSRLQLFANLPRSLETPIKGFKAASEVILALPIPQAVPPGVGIPVSITTKYSDLLRTLKEYTKQAETDIDSINVLLEPTNTYIASIKEISSNLDLALKAYEIQDALNQEVAQKTLQDIGLVNSTGVSIFTELVPLFLGTGDLIGGEIVYTSSTNSKVKVEEDLKKQEAIRLLNTSLSKLEDSNLETDTKNKLRDLLDTLRTPTKTETIQDPKYYYTATDGTVYKLEILIDPTSPSIAPRRFAIAETLDGVVVLRGEPSFSSSVDVLLDEIKFRIDHQLT